MTKPNWRTPAVVLLCGGIIITLSMGTRHGFGLFLKPMTMDLGWSRETFAFALALQNLLWGAAQPFSGMIADRYGAGRVLLAGTTLYVLGLVLMAYATTGLQLSLSAGLLIGIALSCTTWSVIYGVLGRAFPPEKRTMALGIAGAAGSFGQFAMLPITQSLISGYGWLISLLLLAGIAACIAPLASAMVETEKHDHGSQAMQSVSEALREAFAHKSFFLLAAGYFVCGFQVAFIAVHFPAFLIDKGLTANAGVISLALIGLFNIFGTYGAGMLGSKRSKKYLLAMIYVLRSIVITVFLLLPVTAVSAYLFAASIGFLWLSTVPLTNGLVAQIFGVKYLSMLSGIIFFAHQIGSFSGIWLGGYLFDHFGSYNLVWYISIGLGLVAGIANLPIDEREIIRPAAA